MSEEKMSAGATAKAAGLRLLKWMLYVGGWGVGLVVLINAHEAYPLESRIGAGLFVTVWVILKRFEHTEKMIEGLRTEIVRIQLTLRDGP